jgi:hypothetical protein
MDPKAPGWEGADWFDLGSVSAKRRTVVNMALKFLVPNIWGISLDRIVCELWLFTRFRFGLKIDGFFFSTRN